MSENLTKLFTTEFSTNLAIALQQTSSKLRGRVMEGAHTGKQASPVQYIKPVAMKPPAGRFAPKENTNADFVRRWVFPTDGEINQLLDSFDVVRTIVDPKSGYVTGAAAATGRAWDDEIIAAAFRAASLGIDASAFTSETFLTANYQVASTFGSSAASGLTVAKLIEAKRILRHNHVDPEAEPLTLVIGSQQEADLLNQTEIVSTDFNDRPVLVDGRVTRFLGFDIVVSERLSVAANVRNCIATGKSGAYLGVWLETNNDVDQRKDLSGHPWQLYTTASFGATRLEPGRLLSILCSDTTGADVTV